MGKFVTAVATEHKSMGAAFTQASQDGDIVAMAGGVTDAMKAMTSTSDDISQPLADAASVCRAAIK